MLVNRGFVLPEWRKTQAALTPPAPATASVTGLLRMGESGKGFLRNNDPTANLWYGRDLPAIAAARWTRSRPTSSTPIRTAQRAIPRPRRWAG